MPQMRAPGVESSIDLYFTFLSTSIPLYLPFLRVDAGASEGIVANSNTGSILTGWDILPLMTELYLIS